MQAVCVHPGSPLDVLVCMNVGRTLCCVQVPLMGARSSAQAALDAHRGVVAVAEHGLAFFLNLSAPVTNKVSWAWCRLLSSP
jgi:hypothetical protein